MDDNDYDNGDINDGGDCKKSVDDRNNNDVGDNDGGVSVNKDCDGDITDCDDG